MGPDRSLKRSCHRRLAALACRGRDCAAGSRPTRLLAARPICATSVVCLRRLTRRGATHSRRASVQATDEQREAIVNSSDAAYSRRPEVACTDRHGYLYSTFGTRQLATTTTAVTDADEPPAAHSPRSTPLGRNEKVQTEFLWLNSMASPPDTPVETRSQVLAHLCSILAEQCMRAAPVPRRDFFGSCQQSLPPKRVLVARRLR